MFGMAKRVFLFMIVNILVITTISISWNLICYYFGIQDTYMNSLVFFSACFGMGGAFISLLLSKFMAKKMMGVKVIDPQTSHPLHRSLVEKVTHLARLSHLPATPEVGIYESPEVNAFATGPSKKNSLVAVSTGLLEKLEDSEVEGILGHEVAHISNGDMVTMTLIQGVVNAFVIFLSRILANLVAGQVNSERGRFFIHLSLVIAFQILFSILGSVIVNYFSRLREFRADRGGAKLAGKGKMLSALKALQNQSVFQQDKRHESVATLKISGSRKRSSLASLFSTHPPLEDRIRRLERA